ncbi:hypothetical protein, partial [Methanosphaera cuniculi]|uniref:hypothetical protein n=1 Tax=Methanosphaera cuniculi TaxID=1077256 RepID=UPI001B875778
MNKYKFIIIIFMILLSISTISATNLDNNHTSTNEKSITNTNSNPDLQNSNDFPNFNKIDYQTDNNHEKTYDNEISDNEISDNEISDNEISDNEISDNEISDNEISDNETSYDGEISDNNDSSSLKAPSSNSNITYSYNGILVCANNTNNFIKENHYIPAVVKIDNKNVTINDYLHLLCKSLDSTTSQSINTTKYVMSTTGTNCHNMKISKKDYLSLANSIAKCYNINLRNPLKISIYNNTLSFDDAVYFFTKIISWKYTHNGA